MSIRSSDIASFILPSLDPPGEKHDLPPPYNQPPFKRGPLTDKARRRVCIMNPLPRLHRSLIPDLDARWKPPVLLYGWSIGHLMPMLLEYAEEHHLLVYAGGSTKPPSRSGDSDDSDSDAHSVHWGDTDEEDEEEEDEKYVEKLSSAERALYAIALEASVDMGNLPSYRQPFTLGCALHDPHKLVICIYSNYELAYAVSDAAIEKMQKRLGIQEAPAWYVSSIDPTWSRIAPRW
ncbi:uncharacterized protein C8Q71DRAFT_769976 [Rhodofomes roseus]|uniref:Uncharacterized protein n=1 Tax=Rhodofomes roseus TaxID=34475 RepID=A0A4Y9YL11_9APHY|nr:uncharacterized protein C8Q71DRAFT_769976 [Rhodofomes roseus]KAH9834621.1 hypothetical protein C8Q71DRAFT_769976 [Rhodofomes roseus]TFY63105.1 hypothetical protein EVJ58_g3448 [Rhodofomes roseus]